MNTLIVLATVLVSANGLALWGGDAGYFHGYNWGAPNSWPFGWGSPLDAADPFTLLTANSGSIAGTAEVPAEDEEIDEGFESLDGAEDSEIDAEADEATHKVIVPPFPYANNNNLWGANAGIWGGDALSNYGGYGWNGFSGAGLGGWNGAGWGSSGWGGVGLGGYAGAPWGGAGDLGGLGWYGGAVASPWYKKKSQ